MLLMQLWANNATSTIVGSISETEVNVTVADGTAFPTTAAPDFFFCTLEDSTGVWEIAKCVAHAAGNPALTLERGVVHNFGFANGSRLEIRFTAEALASFLQRDGDTIDGGTY